VARSEQDHIIATLLEEHGRTYAEQLGIELAAGTPSPLFRWLCAALLMSARIRAEAAIDAARALADQGWTTAARMAAASWEERTRTLNRAGYARYDESTARMLGDTAELLQDKYQGDLRKLRDAAEREPARERALLKECKGIGEVGVDIFMREAQIVWPELYPFADRKALETAAQLGLDDDPRALADRVPRKDLPRLLAALVRVSLAGGLERSREAAR
jgi:endonuclease III